MNKPIKKVVISNQLNECVQVLTIAEKRLLMLLISKVNDHNIDERIPITVSEYAAEYGISGNGVYTLLQDAQMRLYRREVVLDGEYLRWVISAKPEANTGRITCKIHSDIKPHIHGLKERFTQYYLRRAGDFKSLYSWRLFEQLMQHRSQGWWKISVDKFKDRLDVPKAYDRDYALVRIKVINVALKEIRAAGLPVKLETEKLGRKVHMLRFTFPTEQQLDIFNAPAKSVVNDDYIKKHARPGESWDAARKRLTEELKKETPA